MKLNELSVIIPSYNAANWLPETLQKISVALQNSKIPTKKIEIIIVNDGSSDNTKTIINDIANDFLFKIKVIKQKNSGRYIARKNGVNAAKYKYIWFIDTRVHTDPHALSYIQSELDKDKSAVIWNAHVYVQKSGNLIARFMDAITCIGWRAYFSNPRRTSYGLKEFDKYPKGTTSFLAPTQVIKSAITEFDKESRDLRVSSDDTHLIRIMARDYKINLSPGFSCTYHARTTLGAFTRHSYHRGQVFVDGFYRWGTRFFIPINIFLFIAILIPALLIIYPWLLLYTVLLGIAFWFLELLIALILGIDYKDAFSLALLSPLFTVCYGAGILKAFIKLILKKIQSKI